VADRRQTWLTALLVVVGVIVAVIVSIVSYVRIASPPIHPNPEAVSSVQLTPPSARWTDAVKKSQQMVRANLIEGNLPGLSIAVGVDGEIVWAEGFGWADVAQRLPVGPDTRFRIGHASKALTSAAVGLLLEKGQIDLDAEIQKYVPEFPKKPWPITVRQLMGHLAGIRHYESDADSMPSMHCDRASEGLQIFANEPLKVQPETEYHYSTYGWILVSAAVEAVAKEPFFTYMRNEIFDPLSMADTTSDSPREPMPHLATFYESGFGEARQVATRVDYSCFAGAAGFVSTPSDLVRFGMAMSNGKLLKRETVHMLQSPQRLASGPETQYGLGWMLDTVPLAGEHVRLANHANRALVGGSGSFMTFPDVGLVVAVTTNIAWSSTRQMSLDIAQAFAEQARHPVAK